MILMRVFLCSDTYLLRSSEHHAVCLNVERSEAAHSSFFLSTGVQLGIAIAARSHPMVRPLDAKLDSGSTLELVSPFQIVTNRSG